MIELKSLKKIEKSSVNTYKFSYAYTTQLIRYFRSMLVSIIPFREPNQNLAMQLQVVRIEN